MRHEERSLTRSEGCVLDLAIPLKGDSDTYLVSNGGVLNRLKAVLALAATLNFHRAVQRLGISQTHLTRIIISPEQDLGIILFERGPHGVLLTADGARALKEAATLINAETMFSRSIEALRNGGSETRQIAAGAFVAQAWAGAAVTAMKTAGAAISSCGSGV
jgi:DNA-binding transcriptional LysR family regulator